MFVESEWFNNATDTKMFQKIKVEEPVKCFLPYQWYENRNTYGTTTWMECGNDFATLERVGVKIFKIGNHDTIHNTIHGTMTTPFITPFTTPFTAPWQHHAQHHLHNHSQYHDNTIHYTIHNTIHGTMATLFATPFTTPFTAHKSYSMVVFGRDDYSLKELP